MSADGSNQTNSTELDATLALARVSDDLARLLHCK
jgi:hypothetical protein